jgi:hypothetical protein
MSDEQAPAAPATPAPISEHEQREKRKRSTASVDFDKFTNKEAEDSAVSEEENEEELDKAAPKRRKYGDPTLEKHLTELQAATMLFTLIENFPEIAKKVLDGKDVKSMSDEEKSQACADIRYLQGVKSGTRVNMWVGNMGLKMLEDGLLTFTPINCRGLGQCGADPEFQELWKEVSIDLMTFQYIDPKGRLALWLAKTVYILHNINETQRPSIAMGTPSPTPPPIAPTVQQTPPQSKQ